MHLLLADDHTLFREALAHYLARHRPDMRLTLAADCREAETLLEKTPGIDLAILDFCMPGMNGLDGLKRLRKRWPKIPVAIISGVADADDMKDALAAGAIGFFPKSLSGAALIGAIELTLTGERFAPADFVSPPSSVRRASAQGIALPHLTPREQDVLSHLLTGATNQEIAKALDLQEVTIKLHIRGLCRKLDAKNRTQAALRARALGLLPSLPNR